MEKELFDRVSELQAEHWWFVARKNFVGAVLKPCRDEPRRKVLDIGCGAGSMMSFLKSYGESVVGIDYSEYALKLCGKDGRDDLVRGTVEVLPFLDETFDLVTSFEVLYHKKVGDDAKVIKEMYRICKKGGKVLIIDSAFNFLKGKHDDLAHGIRRYTIKELSGKLKEAGFVMKRSSYLYFTIFPILCAIRFLKNVFLPSDRPSSELQRTAPILNSFMVSLMSLEAFILKKVNFPFGISVLCLAEKV